MLKQVRKALKGVAAWFVIALLVLAFALFGVPELRSFTQRPPLRVGAVNFSIQDIAAEFNREMDQRRRQLGGAYTREQAIAEGVPDTVVSQLTTRSLLEQEAAGMGLSMPRDLVREVLQSDERFHNPATGKFDQFSLQNVLSANGLTVRQFEALLKEDLLRNQLVASITAGVPAPSAMARALILRDVERRRVAYFTVTDDLAGAAATPGAEDLRAYYAANQSKFIAPEYRTFVVATVRTSDVADQVAVSEEDLRKAFDVNKARLYDQPEKRTVYQLTYDNEAAARAAATSLSQGRPFESLAIERGMSLAQATFTDVVRKDLLDPTVAASAFSPDLVEGEVAGPLKSLFGWTVLQLVAVTPAQTKSFDDVRDELALEMGGQANRRQLLEKVDELEEARDTGAGLAAAAEQADAPLQRYGPVDSFSFAPGGAIVADIPGEILAAAFKVQEGEESEALELASDAGYFFVQVEEVTPPESMPYEIIANEVEMRWRNDERNQRIAATTAKIREALAQGATLEDQAGLFDRAVLETIVARNSQIDAFAPEFKNEIFRAAPNAVLEGPAAGAARTIAIVREVGFARNQVGPEQVEAYRPFLGYQLTQEHLDAYLAALQNDYVVRTDKGAVAQIFTDSQ